MTNRPPQDPRAPTSDATADRLGPCGAIARRHDPDRFLCAILAPPARRDAVFTLIAFNHELSRAVEIALSSRGEHGEMAGRIRLQWWRECVDGDAKRHDVADRLAALVIARTVDPALLDAMIASREAELDGGPADRAAWRDTLAMGPGSLSQAIGQATAAPPSALDGIGAIGRAHAIGAILRHRAALVASGRRLLPPGLEPPTLIAEGRDALAAGADLVSTLPRAQRCAALLAPLARRDLARAARSTPETPAGGRGVFDRLAIVSAWAR